MTEHVHEWSWEGGYSKEHRMYVFGIVCICGEYMPLEDATKRLNATERLSAEDARFAVKRIEDHIGYEWDDDEGTMFALDAYADILEGKDET